jgi:hypothetical protein
VSGNSVWGADNSSTCSTCDKGMAHGDLKPSDLLLIEADESYSIHGEVFVIMGEKHNKIVLCNGGRSVCSSCAYMHSSDNTLCLPTV